MNKIEILKKIKEILKKVSRDNLNRYIKNHYPELFNSILDKTNKLDQYAVAGNKNKSISIFERLYCIEHDLDDRPLCLHCHIKRVNRFIKEFNIYGKWCSPSCQAFDTSEEAKHTRLNKYGSSTFNNRDKAKLTRMLKYNGNYVDDNFKIKCKQTKLNRYGDENYVNLNKIKQTKLDRYGDENFNNLNKCKQTKLNKYGDENYNNSNKISKTKQLFSSEKKILINDKTKKTCLERYGVESPMQSRDIQLKTIETLKERYGVESSFSIPKVKEASIQLIKLKSWKCIITNKDYTPCFTVQTYIDNKDPHTEFEWKCNKCGNIFKSTYQNGSHHRCFNCYPNTTSGTSLLELEIVKYVRSITTERVFHREVINRTILDNRFELDIVIPSKKIAIEFNGLYYHTEINGKDKNYHLRKTEQCEKLGYLLIHIFEDEWIYKKNIVKSRLKSILGVGKRKIFARKCEIVNVPTSLKCNFLNKYHILGADKSKLNLGLTYHGHLVAIMTFTKPRFTKKYQWELSRYATVSNFTIVGGASKLLKHFERIETPKSIVTYADRCWSTGNLYFKLNFLLNNKTKPGYSYFKSKLRLNRMRFLKHKLKSILEKYDDTKTEVLNMIDNGYSRIFDCGLLTFSKIY